MLCRNQESDLRFHSLYLLHTLFLWKLRNIKHLTYPSMECHVHLFGGVVVHLFNRFEEQCFSRSEIDSLLYNAGMSPMMALQVPLIMAGCPNMERHSLLYSKHILHALLDVCSLYIVQCLVSSVNACIFQRYAEA